LPAFLFSVFREFSAADIAASVFRCKLRFAIAYGLLKNPLAMDENKDRATFFVVRPARKSNRFQFCRRERLELSCGAFVLLLLEIIATSFGMKTTRTPLF
jgi:hypothetical protein